MLPNSEAFLWGPFSNIIWYLDRIEKFFFIQKLSISGFEFYEVHSSGQFCHFRRFNSFMTEISIIQKPVNWFQITTSVMRELKTTWCQLECFHSFQTSFSRYILARRFCKMFEFWVLYQYIANKVKSANKGSIRNFSR